MSSTTEAIKQYLRAANYLSAIQIYLQENVLLREQLTFNHIKSRLLGHWGTCPGINFTYANLNALITENDLDMLFVLGPGHGFPALQSNLFLEGTLSQFYPEATHTENGITHISQKFSWPYGYPSHSNPGAPGVILEGGELGYSLSTSYGSVLDNPDLITACLVGDGEAETGALATAWHLNKFINPKKDGAVLPILHLNGYKISGPTIFGRMSKSELKSLFTGYGYKPYFVRTTGNGEVTEKDIELMQSTLKSALADIKKIQSEYRSGTNKPNTPPHFPMIVLETPKGWTGIKKLKGNKIEGNCLSHQVTAPEAKTSKVELKALNEWLLSYNFNEIFSPENGFSAPIKSIIPKPERQMGRSRHAHGGDIVEPLALPDIVSFTEDASAPGTIGSSSMRRAGLYLAEIFRQSEKTRNFRLFSPDETYSNKLDEVFSATKRAFAWPIKKWDKDLGPEGRVVEMLSEHSLQGLLQGYVLTGRHAVFASYEAFIQVVASMVDQYAKFLKVARETPFRGKIPSLNYILTSSGWRQDHNGFSHQNPAFIDNVLQKHGCYIHVYFPADGNSTLAVLKKCLASRNEINIICAGKTVEPRWLTPELAEKELVRGLMTWDFASEAKPDIVFCGIGDYLTKESLAAITLLKAELPSVKVRFVNVSELCSLGIGNSDCHVPFNDFSDYFTHEKPVIFNFHGYPETMKPFLFDVSHDVKRFAVFGYIENGSTTTPFDMHVRNNTDRFHLVQTAAKLLARYGTITEQQAADVIKKYDQKLADHRAYIEKHGVDQDEIENWQWKRTW
jgi:xylulose-5-phosphate/fructose-6-phosphate phosphoketolase